MITSSRTLRIDFLGSRVLFGRGRGVGGGSRRVLQRGSSQIGIYLERSRCPLLLLRHLWMDTSLYCVLHLVRTRCTGISFFSWWLLRQRDMTEMMIAKYILHLWFPDLILTKIPRSLECPQR
jgi:hypothetical protein